MPDNYVPTRADNLNHTGTEFYQKGQLKPAYLHFLASLIADPENWRAWMNLGATLTHGGYSKAAEIAGKKGLAIDPESLMFNNNIGNALMAQRKYSEAKTYFLKVLKVVTDDAGVYHNIGLACYMTEDFVQAEKYLRQGLEFWPELVSIRNDMAMAMLAQGKIQEGMAEYECRWETLFQSKIWELGIAPWQGEDLEDKSILIHHEQGFGDSLMLSRFLDQVLDLGAKVTVAVPEELVKLFTENFKNVSVVDWTSELVASEYDFHCPMMSLLRWLKITNKNVISPESYINIPRAPNNKFKIPAAEIKVGICWASGDHGPQLGRRRRYLDLTKLLDLALLPRVQLVSLQKGEAEKDLELICAHAFIHNPMARIENFYDSAQLIAELDMVITVDSAVAHLAGAMGKPVLMFSPSPRCWRWWNMKYNGFPWYQDMSIVSQANDGTWDEAIEEALAEVQFFEKTFHA